MVKREENSLQTAGAKGSLREAEATMYGVERLTESERMRFYMQTQLRSNHKLIIGRVSMPSRKLMSVNLIDHNTLLVDETEHIYLHKRYQDALAIIDRLFAYLMNESDCAVDKQYLLAYDHTSDSINIFCEQ